MPHRGTQRHPWAHALRVVLQIALTCSRNFAGGGVLVVLHAQSLHTQRSLMFARSLFTGTKCYWHLAISRNASVSHGNASVFGARLRLASLPQPQKWSLDFSPITS